MTNDEAFSLVTQPSGLEHFRQPLGEQGVKQLASDIDTAYGPVERKAALCDEALAALAGVVRICEAVRYQVGLGKHQLERIEAAKAVLAKARAREGVGA